jgi:hypothetical protein
MRNGLRAQLVTTFSFRMILDILSLEARVMSRFKSVDLQAAAGVMTVRVAITQKLREKIRSILAVQLTE